MLLTKNVNTYTQKNNKDSFGIIHKFEDIFEGTLGTQKIAPATL